MQQILTKIWNIAPFICTSRLEQRAPEMPPYANVSPHLDLLLFLLLLQ